MHINKLWRYYDVIKFLTLVNGELYFARADKFKDKYEGAIPKQNYLHFAKLYYNSKRMNFKESEVKQDSDIAMIPKDIEQQIKQQFLENFKERKKKVAISCWHLNESESAAMWEVYSKAGQGIAVSTTLGKLEKISKPEGFEMEMYKVDYIDFEKNYDEGYINHELLPFKVKRKEFEYEHEFRIILYKKNKEYTSEFDFVPEEGIRLNINTSELIDEIIASPEMKEYEVAEIQKILDLINQHKGTNFTIRRSGLYENLHY